VRVCGEVVFGWFSKGLIIKPAIGILLRSSKQLN
jgi:hypothetical protein